MAKKADLLSEAQARGLDVSDSNTAAEIEAALAADGYTAPAGTADAAADFTNQPEYDPKGHGLDYGGDGVGGGNIDEVDAAATERGYFGNAPGEEIDGDLTVKGVGNG